MSDERPDGPTEAPTGPPSFAPMDNAGPTDEVDPAAPSTAQFAPVPGGVIAGGAAARLGADGMPPMPSSAPPHDDSATQALGVVQPPPGAVPPPPGVPVAPPPASPRPYDPGATLDDVPAWGAPQWGAGPLDGGPPSHPGAPVLAKTDEQPAVGWVTGGAAGVVGADALAGTGIRPPGAPTFQPPPPPPPGALPPPHASGSAGPGAPPPARSGGGATPWILAVLLVAALVAVVVLVVRGSSLTDDRDEADARADELAGDVDDLAQERDDLQDQIQDLEDQIQALEEDGGGLPDDLEQLQEELDQRQAAIAALEDELDAREAELDQREAELDQREQEIEDQESGLGDGELTDAADLLIGDCILEPIDSALGVPEQVTVVACSTSHQGEVFAQEDVADAIDGVYPGQAVLLEGAVTFCGGAVFDAYFGGTPAATGLLPAPRLPSATAWDAGDTIVVCAAYPADGLAVTGSQAG